MVASLRAACNIPSAFSCHSKLSSTRGLRTFCALRADAPTPDALNPPPRSPVVRRTRKKFTELPKARLPIDGNHITPLGSWQGGLAGCHTTYHNDAPVISRPVTPSNEPSRERGPDVAADITDSTLDFNQAGSSMPDSSRSQVPGFPVDEAVKPKRKRRTKAAKVAQDADDSTPAASQPRNPLATEILDNLTKFPHCILLTRVGQFYESYFDQAIEVARLLNIKLTQRTWDGQRIWMCGFPLMHLNKYLKIMVQHQNRFVALCEEFPRSPQLGARGGFDRRVVRIVTPGTLIDEPFLNPYENNYLLAIASMPPYAGGSDAMQASVGLAWIDVSTGEFFTKHTVVEGLRDELVRISPREVIIDSQEMPNESHPIRLAVAEEQCFVSYFTPHETTDDDASVQIPDASGSDDVTSSVNTFEHQPPSALSDPEVGAITLLTAFMRTNLLEHMPQLLSPSRETTASRMQIDSHTIKALEIRQGINDGTAGSLLSVVKRTVTSSGTRLLARWLCSPSTSIYEIHARQSLVAFFHARPYLREDIVQALRDIEDATRIVQKFLIGRGQAGDLVDIRTTIESWASVKRRFALEKAMEERERGALIEQDWKSLDALMCRMVDLGELSDSIQRALVHVDTPASVDMVDGDNSEGNQADSIVTIQGRLTKAAFGSDGWTIKPEFSKELGDIHTALTELFDRRDKMERNLQSTYNSPSLTLRSSPGQGMHVHISRGKRDSSKLKSSPLFIPISESNSTNTFFFQEWSQLGAQIVDTVTSIHSAEREALEMLRNEVNVHSTHLRQNARILDELDVTLAFASLASEMNWVRPTLNENMSYHVVNGRHPTVELGLLTAGRVFSPNTVTFTPDSNFHVITGPNMAGKSTLLRQTALIAILAQAGSFVPADSAEIGIVDRVFSRVGAKDDLFQDRSTFMVEMLETSEILRRATPASLVIMDEVGRGTTVDDGLAIAFASAHHLLSINRCRALFATHFHELADLLGYCDVLHKGRGSFENVSFLCTDVDETEDGYFAYSHRLRPGVNRDSHGLKVAQLAGLPDPAVQVAEATISWLKERRAHTENSQVALQAFGQSLASQK